MAFEQGGLGRARPSAVDDSFDRVLELELVVAPLGEQGILFEGNDLDGLPARLDVTGERAHGVVDEAKVVAHAAARVVGEDRRERRLLHLHVVVLAGRDGRAVRHRARIVTGLVLHRDRATVRVLEDQAHADARCAVHGERQGVLAVGHRDVVPVDVVAGVGGVARRLCPPRAESPCPACRSHRVRTSERPRAAGSGSRSRQPASSRTRRRPSGSCRRSVTRSRAAPPAAHGSVPVSGRRP